MHFNQAIFVLRPAARSRARVVSNRCPRSQMDQDYPSDPADGLQGSREPRAPDATYLTTHSASPPAPGYVTVVHPTGVPTRTNTSHNGIDKNNKPELHIVQW